MNITNDRNVMVFKNDKGKYSVGISKKNQTGEYEKAYFPIQFNKDVELEDRTLIKIKTAWLSFYKWEYELKTGTTFFIKCSDFEIVEQDNKEEHNAQLKMETDPYKDFGDSIEIKEEDLPF